MDDTPTAPPNIYTEDEVAIAGQRLQRDAIQAVMERMEEQLAQERRLQPYQAELLTRYIAPPAFTVDAWWPTQTAARAIEGAWLDPQTKPRRPRPKTLHDAFDR